MVFMNKTVASKLYGEITSILLEAGEINVIPPLKKTENRRVYGYLKTVYTKNAVTGWSSKEKYVGVYLNLHEIPNYKDCYNLNKVHYSTYRNNVKLFMNAIDTICHELAHMKCHSHGPTHSNITNHYMTVYFSKCGHIDSDGNFSIKHFLSDVKEHA